MSNNKNLIITGGVGFIGTYLTKALKDKYQRVIIIDKDQEKISELFLKYKEAKFDNIELYEQDLTQENNFKNLIKELEETEEIFDIIHLASTVGPENITVQNCQNDFNLNFTIYKILKDSNLKINKFIFTSSSEVYNQKEEIILKENEPVSFSVMSPEDPNEPFSLRALYKTQKLQGELLFLNLAKEKGFKTIVTRLFNVIGKGQKEGFVFSNFMKVLRNNIEVLKNSFSNIQEDKDIQEILNKQEIKLNDTDKEILLSKFQKFQIYGTGDQVRVFLAIEDLVNIFTLLLDYNKEPKKLKNKNNQILNNIINIANLSNEMSIKNLAIEINKVFFDIINSSIEELIKQKELKPNEMVILKYLSLIIDNFSLEDFLEIHDEISQTDYTKIGDNKRLPLVYKLYNILKYKPELTIQNIIYRTL